ncbi:MAG: hypothetical protein ACJ8C8_23735, partial [Microvirga sp.]
KVDESIPIMLNFIRNLLDRPGEQGKRAFFAFWRSIENIFIACFDFVFRRGHELLDKTAESTISAFSKAAPLGIAALVIAMYSDLSSWMMAMPTFSWIIRHIDKIKELLALIK